LAFVYNHKKIKIATSGGEDISFESYSKSRHFIKDKDELHQIFDDIQSNKTAIIKWNLFLTD